MESVYFKNKNVDYSLCVIDVFTKYTWVKPIKDEKGRTVANGFIKIVHESHRKPTKLWLDLRREFCKKIIQEWLGNNDTLVYSTHKKDSQ